ncbi:hypothetical protein KUF71_021675, partial [Frankliniella fusca]
MGCHGDTVFMQVEQAATVLPNAGGYEVKGAEGRGSMAKTAAAEPGGGGRGRVGLQGRGSVSAGSAPAPPPHPTLESIGRSRTFIIERNEEGEDKKSDEVGLPPEQQPSVEAAGAPVAVPTPAPRERRLRPGRPVPPEPPAAVVASAEAEVREQERQTAAPVPAPRAPRAPRRAAAAGVATSVELTTSTAHVEEPVAAAAPSSPAARGEARRRPGTDADAGRGEGRRRLLRRQEAGDSSSSDAEPARGRGGQKVVLVTEAEVHHPPSSPSPRAEQQGLRKAVRQEPGASRRGSAIQGALLDEIKREPGASRRGSAIQGALLDEIKRVSQTSQDSTPASVDGQEQDDVCASSAGRPDTVGDALLEDGEAEHDVRREGGAGRLETSGDVLLEAYEEPAAIPADTDVPEETDNKALTPDGAPGDELADQPDHLEGLHAEQEVPPVGIFADHASSVDAHLALVQEGSETTLEQQPQRSTGTHSPILEAKPEDLTPDVTPVTAPDTPPLLPGKAPDHDPPPVTPFSREDQPSPAVTVPEALERAGAVPDDQHPAVTVPHGTPPPSAEPVPGDLPKVTTLEEAASPPEHSTGGSGEVEGAEVEGAPLDAPRDAPRDAARVDAHAIPQDAETPSAGEAPTASPGRQVQADTRRTLHPLDEATRERLQQQIERAVLSAVAGPSSVSREALQVGLDQASAALSAFYATPACSEVEAVRLRAGDLLRRVLRLKVWS